MTTGTRQEKKRRVFPYYEEIEAILGCHHDIDPPHLCGSNVEMESETQCPVVSVIRTLTTSLQKAEVRTRAKAPRGKNAVV